MVRHRLFLEAHADTEDLPAAGEAAGVLVLDVTPPGFWCAYMAVSGPLDKLAAFVEDHWGSDGWFDEDDEKELSVREYIVRFGESL